MGSEPQPLRSTSVDGSFPDAGTIARLAGAALGPDNATTVLASGLVPIGGPVFNMTTSGLWRLKVSVTGRSGPQTMSAVLKIIQTPLRWPGIGAVPPEARDSLVQHYPWRTEAEVYGSDLGRFLPGGFRMPVSYGTEVLDSESIALWMEDVAEDSRITWDDGLFARMAYFLGRLAGVSGAPTGAVRDVGAYADGPGHHVFIPLLRSGVLHTHPAFEGAVDAGLEQDMIAFTRQIPALVQESAGIPTRRAHGDACPQNLLQTSGGTVAIDWGSFGRYVVGFDLGQLLSGRVNQGVMQGSELYRLAPLCLTAYLDGLEDGGTVFPRGVVRRGFAVSTAIISGLSALCPEELRGPLTDDLRTLVAARAGMARFLLDELNETATAS
ncbi:phosphotransferase [Arthrobacter sp. Br18]|uniref:phosphotransferase n=1 Tax=Arthrobacter sp. Br18 TaxID=1312954 RepID=UPI00047D31FF|nr:phosphotransferase [Arthrobacter sp. Br18]